MVAVSLYLLLRALEPGWGGGGDTASLPSYTFLFLLFLCPEQQRSFFCYFTSRDIQQQTKMNGQRIAQFLRQPHGLLVNLALALAQKCMPVASKCYLKNVIQRAKRSHIPSHNSLQNIRSQTVGSLSCMFDSYRCSKQLGKIVTGRVYFEDLGVVVWIILKWTWNKKVKLIHLNVKWSRYRPGVAQRVDRGIALLFHDRGTRKVWVFSSTPRPHFTPGKDPVPILQEAEWALRAGLDERKISSPLGFDPLPSSP